MEDKSMSIIAANLPIITKDDTKLPVDGKKKKKRSPFNLLKAALFMLRGQSKGSKSKSVHVEVAANGMLKKLVGSMRPLHLHDSQTPPLLVPGSPSPPTGEPYEDVFPQTTSPHYAASVASSSSVDGMSRYASATNLQELEKGGESRYASATNLKELDEGESDDESDHWIDEKAGDEMIDVKAEEFIAHFYLQMRQQHVKSVDRYNKRMAKGKH